MLSLQTVTLMISVTLTVSGFNAVADQVVCARCHATEFSRHIENISWIHCHCRFMSIRALHDALQVLPQATTGSVTQCVI